MLTPSWALAVALAFQNGTPAVDHAKLAWPDDRPLSHFISNLGQDVRELPSLNNAFILAGGTMLAVGLRSADDRVAIWAGESGTSSWSDIGAVLGDGWVQGTAAMFTYAVGRIQHSPKVTHMGSDLVRAQILNGVITKSLKHTVSRRRPGGGRHAFPSGHTAAAFASASVLHGHFGWKMALPAYSLATFVGWSRLRDKEHWISDVAAGATIGTIVGQAVTSGHRKRAWTITPAATPGGFAVYIYKN